MRKRRYGLQTVILGAAVLMMLTGCGKKEQILEETTASAVETEPGQAEESIVAQITEPAELMEIEPVLTLDEEVPLDGLYSDLDYTNRENITDLTLIENSELEIEGKKVNLPCTIKDLEEIGAYFGDAEDPLDSDQYALANEGELGYEDGMITPGARGVGGSMYYEMSDGRTIEIDIWSENNTNDFVKLGDIIANYITIKPEEVKIGIELESTTWPTLTLDDLQYDIALNDVKIGMNYKDIMPILGLRGYDANMVVYQDGIDFAPIDSEEVDKRLACTTFYSDYTAIPYAQIDYNYYDGFIFALRYTYKTGL